jgi:hypothetical protein
MIKGETMDTIETTTVEQAPQIVELELAELALIGGGYGNVDVSY